ncbi:MAG: FAD-dependent oxidoreductase [Chitinophagaceae bacterium]
MLLHQNVLKRALCFLLPLLFLQAAAQQAHRTAVLVVGGGTGGTAAGIQAARAGALTIIAEPTPWLGGMLSAAGVTATDGNHLLPSGLWEAFRQQVYNVYGGPKYVSTGWVSNMLFEPRVADSILKSMAAAEKKLTVKHGWHFESVLKEGDKVTGAVFTDMKKKRHQVLADIVIDATELGDVLAKAGAGYDVGMEADALTGEGVGVPSTNNIIQELTYAAILKDYGKGADKTIPRPAHYDPREFDCSSTSYCHDATKEQPNVDAAKMLEYGRLPNNKYMINWPKAGNDIYLNIIECSPAQREKELVKAKEMTYRFVYFIQHELGFKHLGLADDEFPTKDRMPFIPYHREGRRVHGLVRFNIKHISEPFSYGDPLYRTGISVGDYPIDHHHKKNKEAPQHLEFFPVPSFNVPMGALIPQGVKGLIVAEKGISVSNVVNGTTRLQPCVFLTGQAAGMLAALAVNQHKQPSDVHVRELQQQLLSEKVMIMPYIDVPPSDKDFEAIHRIGATGIIKGTGVPYKWANQTWFYPDQPISAYELVQGLKPFFPAFDKYLGASGALLTEGELVELLHIADPSIKMKASVPGKILSRRAVAVMVDKWLRPFEKNISIKGHLQ